MATICSALRYAFLVEPRTKANHRWSIAFCRFVTDGTLAQ